MRLRLLPCLIALWAGGCSLSHNPDLPSFIPPGGDGDGDGDGIGDGDGDGPGDGDGDSSSGTGGALPLPLLGGAGGELGGEGGAR